MPIYEYECLSCGHRMEAMQQIGDRALSECPACAKADLRRLVSVAGFRLKGSGWYATDFKDKGKQKPTKGDTETKKPAEGAAAAPDTQKSESPKTTTASG